MGKTTRRKFSPEFKAKVALEALKEQSTLADLSKKYEVSQEMISRWKNELLGNASSVFDSKKKKAQDEEQKYDELYAQIGKLKCKLDFAQRVSKKLGIPLPADD